MTLKDECECGCNRFIAVATQTVDFKLKGKTLTAIDEEPPELEGMYMCGRCFKKYSKDNFEEIITRGNNN